MQLLEFKVGEKGIALNTFSSWSHKLLYNEIICISVVLIITIDIDVQ